MAVVSLQESLAWEIGVFPLGDCKRHNAVSQLAEMPHPNRPFRYALEGQQYGVDFIKLSTRVRPDAVTGDYSPIAAIEQCDQASH